MTLRDNNGDGALHWAAYKGFEELCGMLIHCFPQELNSADTFGQVSTIHRRPPPHTSNPDALIGLPSFTFIMLRLPFTSLLFAATTK